MTTPVEIITTPAGTELSAQEQQMLAQCEEIIGKNMLGVVEFGKALAKIRDLKLYRAQYETWEDYVARRWEIKARTSYQYITAAEVFENVRNCAQIENLPTNEFQLRQLSRLSDEFQIQAWQNAVKTAPDGKVTARHVARIVSEMLGEQISNKAAAQQHQVRKSTELPQDMKDLFWNLIEKVREARLSNLAKSVREDLKRRLQGVLQLLDD